jgi:hypothetical protein
MVVQRPAKSWSGDWLESSSLSTSANRGIAQIGRAQASST